MIDREKNYFERHAVRVNHHRELAQDLAGSAGQHWPIIKRAAVRDVELN